MERNYKNGTLASKIISYTLTDPDGAKKKAIKYCLDALKSDWRYKKDFKEKLTEDDLDVSFYKYITVDYEFSYEVKRTKTVNKDVLVGYETKYETSGGSETWVDGTKIDIPGSVTSSRTRPVYRTVQQQEIYYETYNGKYTHPRDVSKLGNYTDGYEMKNITSIDFAENFKELIKSLGKTAGPEDLQKIFPYVYSNESAEKFILENKKDWRCAKSSVQSITVKDVRIRIFDAIKVFLRGDKSTVFCEDVLMVEFEQDQVIIKEPKVTLQSNEVFEFEHKCRKQKNITGFVKFLMILYIFVPVLIDGYLNLSAGENFFKLSRAYFTFIIFLAIFFLFNIFTKRSVLKDFAQGEALNYYKREKAERKYKTAVTKFYVFSIIYFVCVIALTILSLVL